MRAERLRPPLAWSQRSVEPLFAALLALVFAPAAVELARSWTTLEYQSHGFLIPFLAAWLAYAQQAAHRRLPRARDRRGAFALAAVLALYAGAIAAQVVALQGLALVGALAAAVWWLRGAAWLRLFAFPLGFLLFMVPLPPVLVSPVVVELLGFVSSTAVGLLDAVGIAVTREGNTLRLPAGQSLFVAEACSGLTSLVTMVPIAVLLAHVIPMSLGRKLALVALVVPFAMGANLLRVLATVLGAYWWSVEAVTSEPAHTLAGLMVYIVACLMLAGAARSLSRKAAPG